VPAHLRNSAAARDDNAIAAARAPADTRHTSNF